MSEHSDIGCNIGFDAGYALAKKECAERIKELEAELLSALAQAEHNGDELAALRKRIEELETEKLNAWLRDEEIQDLNQARLAAETELTALRQKIEDAPVVAWEGANACGLYREQTEDEDIALISKEDLTK